MSHCGVAWGLPIRPAGRWAMTFLASLQSQGLGMSLWLFRPKGKSISGWPPALVIEGRAEIADLDAGGGRATGRSIPTKNNRHQTDGP